MNVYLSWRTPRPTLREETEDTHAFALRRRPKRYSFSPLLLRMMRSLLGDVGVRRRGDSASQASDAQQRTGHQRRTLEAKHLSRRKLGLVTLVAAVAMMLAIVAAMLATPVSAAPPSGPINLETEVIGRQVHLTWEAPTSGDRAVGYNVFHKLAGTDLGEPLFSLRRQ